MRVRPAIVVSALVIAAFGIAFALRAGGQDEPSAFPGKRAAELDVPAGNVRADDIGATQDIPTLRARHKARRAAPKAAPAPAPAPAPKPARTRRRRTTPTPTPAPVQVAPRPAPVVTPAPKPAPKPKAPSNTGNFDDSG
jgi:hypothetical protein